MPDWRTALRAIFTAPDAPALADLRAELDQLRTDARLESLAARGLLPVDDAGLAAARQLMAASPDLLEAVLLAPRPADRATIAATAAPPAPDPDPIAAAAAASGEPYHIAAHAAEAAPPAA